MFEVNSFLKDHPAVIPALLVCASIFLFSFQITRPLVDYDEATYAKVVVDTIKSGDILSFRLGNDSYFGKPPLYLWMDIASVHLLGTNELAFRVPSVIFSVLCILLVYAIIKVSTADVAAAAIGAFILLTSEVFLILGREVRTDQGVVAGILAALLFLVKGWKDPRYLPLVFPSIALGFMCKSVIVFLAFPVILLYSLFYRQWEWLKNPYLWLGLIPSFLVVIPWHVYETIVFGHMFWGRYLGQVFTLAGTTIPGTTFDYFQYFTSFYKPWCFALVIVTCAIVGLASFKRNRSSDLLYLLAPSSAAILIIILFSIARTHLLPYILPAYPFFAMYLALFFSYVRSKVTKPKLALLVIVIVALCAAPYVFYSTITAMDQVPNVTYDEQAIGNIYAKNPNGTLYSLAWPVLETVNYYAATSTVYLDPKYVSGKILIAPFYLVVPVEAVHLLPVVPSTPLNTGLKVVYQGPRLVLLFDDEDLQLPKF